MSTKSFKPFSPAFWPAVDNIYNENKRKITKIFQVGMRAIVYYMGTTVSAVALGIVLVVAIHPGVAGQDKVEQ